jgi:histidine triad (HIT) family protein
LQKLDIELPLGELENTGCGSMGALDCISQCLLWTERQQKMSDPKCLFCRIMTGEIPAGKVYEDDHSFAFRDVNPQAPTHVLLIPKKHISSLNEASAEDHAVLGHLLRVAPQIARQEGVADNGFRVVVNTGADAGQSVWHIHLHIMGGRSMAWPPG